MLPLPHRWQGRAGGPGCIIVTMSLTSHSSRAKRIDGLYLVGKGAHRALPIGGDADERGERSSGSWACARANTPRDQHSKYSPSADLLWCGVAGLLGGLRKRVLVLSPGRGES